MPYESKDDPLLDRWAFARRLAGSFAAAVLLAAVSLAAGMAGYGYFEGLPWIDAFLNASMILSGMGPVDDMRTEEGKLFAGCYALYSGLVVIIVTGFLLGPLAHRALHRFHLSDEDEDEEKKEQGK